MIKSFNQFIEERTKEIKIPRGSLGIERDKMPQIQSNKLSQFVKYLKSVGVNTGKMPMRIKDLKLTQSEINKDKVRKMIDSAPEDALSKPIIVSKDNFILDGHHRFVALFNMNPNKKLMSYHVDVNMDILLGIARDFPDSFTKGIDESI